MHEKPSIAERVSDLLGLATNGLELVLAKGLRDLGQTDPELVGRMQQRLGPGYRVTPTWDEKSVDKHLATLEDACAASVKAFSDAKAANYRMMDELKRSRSSLDRAGTPRDRVGIDCSIIASHQRAIHQSVLQAHLQAARALCAMQEIQDSIVLIHKCEPDPCAALPPQPEQKDNPAKKEAEALAEPEPVAVEQADDPDRFAAMSSEATKRRRGSAT
jgi:hypothetical protein